MCLMCHLKHFYANKDIKLSFGKVANCFMIFSPSHSLAPLRMQREKKVLQEILRLFIHMTTGAH